MCHGYRWQREEKGEERRETVFLSDLFDREPASGRPQPVEADAEREIERDHELVMTER